MFLFEYIIKLLMGNTEALFMGLLVVIFGYYGWLLWNLSNNYNIFFNKWEKHNENYMETRKIIFELERKLTRLENLTPLMNSVKDDMSKSTKDILEEIDEETEEIKEIVKILLGQYRKAEIKKINNKKSFDKDKIIDNNIDNENKNDK